MRAVASVTAVTILALWLAAARPVNPALFAAAGAIALVAIAAGLAAADRFGRGLSFSGAGAVRAPSRGEAIRRLAWSGLLGFAVGATILAILIFGLVPLEPALGERLRSRAPAPGWMPVALAFESSVLEEVAFRLLLLSCLVWLLARGWRREVREASPVAVRSAILVSSAAFGLAHVPPWISAAGIALGQVYWRWGLEAAVVCHLTADLVVQGLGPRLLT